MKIMIGSDEAGYRMKESVKLLLEEKGYEILDVGVFDEKPVLYPDIAVKGAEKIMTGEVKRGILICGTGIGMAMTANSLPGIRAAVCHDAYSTERSILSNNAQIMCLGARVIGLELAKMLVNLWLRLEYRDGPSTKKIERMEYYDEKYRDYQDE